MTHLTDGAAAPRLDVPTAPRISRRLRAFCSIAVVAAALLMPDAALASAGCTAVNAGTLNISGFSMSAAQAGFAIGDQLTISYHATHVNDNFKLSPTSGGPDLHNFHPTLVTTVKSHTLSASQLDLTVTIFAFAGPVSATATCIAALPPAPTVTAISPTSGTVAGATAVTITGTDLTGASSVTIGGVAATAITVVNSTTISASSPAHAAGTVNVTVTTPSGTGTGSALYTYVAVPAVTAISPTSGTTLGGTAITITGSAFTGATAVSVGGVAASGVTVVNATTISAVTPAHGAALTDVAVTTSGGTGTGNGLYTYASVPAVTAVSPTIGTTLGGTPVTITGFGFVGATAVSVGGVAASSMTVVNATTITAVTPAHAGGAVDVVVTTPGGPGTGTNLYTYASGPTITSITPAIGPVAGGTAITISGTNLTAATSVLVGGVVVTQLSVLSATSITAITPAHAAGQVDVQVTTPGGTGTGARLYVYAGEPIVTAIAPLNGPTNGGTDVTITGTGLSAVSAVTIGGTSVTGLTVVNDTTLTATTPAHGAGDVNVVVTTAGGTGSGGLYTYVSDLTLASTTASAVTQVGDAYSQASVASGGTPPYAYMVSAGGLPPGTSLGAATGLVSGVPTTSGAFSYTVTVADSGSPTLTASRVMAGTMNAIVTTTTLESSLNPSLTGQPVTLAASVAPSPATGSVTFMDDGATLCSAVPLTSAGATCLVTFAVAGEHPITALYSGDAARDRSTSVAMTQMVTDQRIKTVAVIGRFMSRRNDLIAANEPDASRQIDRLAENGASGGPLRVTGSSDGPLQFGYATSLSRLRRVSAAAQPSVQAAGSPGNPLDIWIEGRYGSFGDHRATNDLDGHFNLVSIGADYVLNRSLLVGSMVQFDSVRQRSSLQKSEASGHGWTIGPYATVRLADNLFGQVRAAWGRSNNEVRPFQSYTDAFGTGRWLLASALSGRFERGPWVLRPSVSVTYLEDVSQRYTDAFGSAVPSVRSRLAQGKAGPQLEYVYHLSSGVVLQPRVGLQLVANLAGATVADGFRELDSATAGPPGTRGRIDAGFRVIRLKGFGFDVIGSYDGIGAGDYPALAGQVLVNVPLR